MIVSSKEESKYDLLMLKLFVEYVSIWSNENMSI